MAAGSLGRLMLAGSKTTVPRHRLVVRYHPPADRLSPATTRRRHPKSNRRQSVRKGAAMRTLLTATVRPGSGASCLRSSRDGQHRHSVVGKNFFAACHGAEPPTRSVGTCTGDPLTEPSQKSTFTRPGCRLLAAGRAPCCPNHGPPTSQLCAFGGMMVYRVSTAYPKVQYILEAFDRRRKRGDIGVGRFTHLIVAEVLNTSVGVLT